MPNAWYLVSVLFILGSWRAIVVDVFTPWLSLQQKLDGSWGWSCSVVESLMLSWEVQSCKSSFITSHGCEVFRGTATVCHWWHTRSAILINTSQATKYLVLGDCKSASPGRNKVRFLIELMVWTKGKTFVHTLLPLTTWEVWRCPSDDLLHIVLLNSRSIWGYRPKGSFEEDEADGVINFKNLWKLGR
jgi:hypothetical protein